ncbi:hypothetical protein NF27_IV00070 [Candidatus Jidaibacter acanthamoeba]|uniref:Uncharacterized protein n=1 Tax=Candidatus Jidaibacter acanthamoebae TaxID=86105 RepID=A0A0C1QW46_9RICK|nr:tetratricopeptide repeat protein [Candidatus Jidaibacter acanthamoeba]KIE04220.1 hypothetical protein NF27_IV00070 [Candidatus Jidaibacter acanthamoeba]
MTKTIYVPQGYCARLIPTSESYDIGGLYTDGFSTCNILACISEEEVILAHVDNLTLMFWNENLGQAIKQIKNLKEIIIISRENEKHVNEALISFINFIGFQSLIVKKEVDINHGGIYISFNKQNDSDIHPNITKYPRSREGLELIHHPQEQQIEAVQKIHQIVGMNAKFNAQNMPKKKFLIFDGQAWEPMDKVELTIDTSNQITKEEMNFISKEAPFIEVAGRLIGIAESIKNKVQIITPPKELSMQVAFYMEGYLNQYNHSLLFKRNLKEIIDNITAKPQTKEDRRLKKNLNTILIKDNDIFSEVNNLCKSYKENAPDNQFKTYITIDIKDLSEMYLKRKYYHDLKQLYQEFQETALRLNKEGFDCYQAKNFSRATQLFRSAIKYFTYCSSKDNPKLASVYYSCGRSHQQLGEYDEAKFFLNTSLTLRENYIEPRPRAEIERTKKAIDECIRAQEQSSTIWVESSSNRASSNSQGLGK